MTEPRAGEKKCQNPFPARSLSSGARWDPATWAGPRARFARAPALVLVLTSTLHYRYSANVLQCR
ncbi:unnamed protein product [Prunus armeniaca]